MERTKYSQLKDYDQEMFNTIDSLLLAYDSNKEKISILLALIEKYKKGLLYGRDLK
jgi:hypothetical protein